MGQIDAVDACLRIADLHRRAVEDQLALDAAEGRPRRFVGRLRAAGGRARHVGEAHVLDMAGDAELALLGAARAMEGEVPEVALDPHGQVLHGAALHGPRHVGAGVRRNAQRQIARHADRRTMRDLAVELDVAGIAAAARDALPAAGRPGARQLALQVGIGKAHVLQLQRDLGRLAGGSGRIDMPLQRGAHLVHRHQRFLEDAGEFERAVDDAELRITALLGRVERDRRVAQPGPPDGIRLGRGLGCERQAAQCAFQLIGGRRVERAAPAGRKVAHHALRVQLAQQLAHRVAQRHARGDLRHQRQVQPLRAEVAACGALTGARVPVQRHVAARPADAVAGQETELACRQCPVLVAMLAGEPAFDLREHQRLHVGGQLQRDLAQGHVDGRAAGLAVVHVEPGPHGAVAFAELERQRHVPAQLADVGARQLRVDDAAPALPVAALGQQRLGEARAQREALAPLGRRRGIQAHLVAAQAVAHHQLHVGERQRRRAALLVGPAQRAAADHELRLAEEPVGRRAVAAARSAQVQAGDEEMPLRIAPHLQMGVVDQQLVEAQLQGEQRMRRQRGHDAWQHERGVPAAVLQHHALQLQRGHPAGRAHADVANSHRNSECAGRPFLDLGPPLLDVRQNPPVQCQPGDKQ